MYITETKLLIDEIDTPILKTNGLFVKGRALHKALFQGEYHTIKTDVVEELIKNGATNTSSGGPEQILGFSMTVYPQYDNMPLESVTLRRRDTEGTANCLSTPLYMYIDCFVGNELVKTIYSDNNVRQVASDNLQSTWNFVDSEFRLSQSFSRVQFRFTQQKGNRQNKTARSSYMGSQSNKLYIEGWKTMYPNQSAGNEWRNFSTNFYINVKKGYSGIQQHIDNDVIHFTEENRQQLNQQYEDLSTALESHVDDVGIHVTAQEKKKINSITGDLGDLNGKLVNLINAHKNQEGLHWTVDDRKSMVSMNSSISTVSNDLKKHKADMNLHWSESDKMKINQCIEHIPNINQKFEDIHSELENTLQTSYTTLREGLELFAGGRMATKVIQLSRAHFTDGKIKEIHIPYYNYAQADSGKTANLCVQIFYAGQTEQTLKPDSECFWSTDVITQDKYGTSYPADAGVSIFKFDNLEIPRDYSFVRLCFVSDIGQNPNGTDNCVEYRIQVLSPKGNSSSSGYTSFDDDICKLLPSGSNYFGYVNVIKANKLEEITDFQTKFDYFSNHVSETRIHVSPADREKWDNIVIPDPITYTAGDGIEITDNNISVITTDVIEESDKIPTSKAVFNEIYDTKVFKNLDRTKHTVGQDSVGTIVFGRKHFISGIVSKITIPHDNKTGEGAGQNGYLAIQVFDEKLDENNQSVLEQVAIYYSTEEEQYNTTKGKYEFLFDNVVIPENYKQIHLTVVENKTIVPSPTSSGNRQVRLYCLAKYDDKNENIVYEEDDECYVHWKTNTNGTSAGGANYVAVVEVEYKKPCYDVVNEKIEKITDYKSNISSTVYTTTDFLPSGTVEQEDSVQKIQILLNNDIKTGYSKTNKLTNVSIHRHATDGNYNTKYYLQIRAWDKTTNELYKFTSIDKHSQSESKVISWYFEDVYFEENLKDVIAMGFVSTKDAGDFVGGTPIRVGTWNVNGSRWYLNEWKVSLNNAWQNRTPHVSLEFESSDSSINHKLHNLMEIITSLQEKIQTLQEQVNSLKETS